jgi:hypothetical protein
MSALCDQRSQSIVNQELQVLGGFVKGIIPLFFLAHFVEIANDLQKFLFVPHES